jgi:HlyD family secretion protein
MSTSPTVRRRLRVTRPMILGAGVVILAIVAILGWQMRPQAPKEPFRMAAVERGDITKSVSASGSLRALNTVDVGSQISGQINRVAVDFNDQVHKGQLMATIDPQTFQSKVAQGQADVQAGEATVRQAQAQLVNAKADYDRKKTLVDQGWDSPSTLDIATAAYRNAEAALGAARARVVQSRATLHSSQVDLNRTMIVAPIDGVIVDRKVQAGNTVAASLQAPVLFTIAEDLSKLQVKISVDEADVGQVREGQTVRFTVDAFPDENFQGVVTQVRKQPTTEQNVVAYTVIAEADNPQGKLMPGMTANADIVIETHRGVLKVPAAALRWNPSGTSSPTRAVTAFGGAGLSGGGFRPPGGGGGGGQNGQAGQRGGNAMLASLPDLVGLDAGQRKQWDVIQSDLRQKMAAAFTSSGGDRTQARETMRKAYDAAFAKLEPSLRPDQKPKLAAFRATLAQARSGGAGAQVSGVVYVLRDAKPVAVAVQVGASDGTNTEVAGALKPDDQVIIGGGPKPKAKITTPFGPSGGQGGANGNQTRARA